MNFSANATEIRRAAARAGGHDGPMDNNRRLHRATRVFLASLLISFGAAAPEVLRQMADELEELEEEAAPRSAPGALSDEGLPSSRT